MQLPRWIFVHLAVAAALLSSTLLGEHAAAQNDLLVTGISEGTIERFDATTGEFLGTFVTGLDFPADVAVGNDENVYVSNLNTNSILRFDGETGAFMDVFIADINAPYQMHFRGDMLYVTNLAVGNDNFVKRYNANTGEFIDDFIQVQNNPSIVFTDDSVYASVFSDGFAVGGVNRYDINTGAFIEEFIAPGEGGLSGPSSLLLEDDGWLIGSWFTNSVKRYDLNGRFLGDAITGLNGPDGATIGPDGNLYITSVRDGQVLQYDPDTYEQLSVFASVNGVANLFEFRSGITAVPEPTAALPLLAVGMGLLCRRSRRKTPKSMRLGPETSSNDAMSARLN
ncbi:MAG: hypothetical protein AAFX06_14585 [Planctomycetota bacterium]